jgi:diguanylate cyclase (GGDEF)-like protein/PAS domain S-box-containing protein
LPECAAAVRAARGAQFVAGLRLRGLKMSDRTELLESALDSLPDGVGVFSEADEVIWWNPAAEAITGFAGMDLLQRPIPEMLEPLLQNGPRAIEVMNQAGRGTLVRVRHKLGHEVAVMARALVLRDGMGERIGMAAVFHSAESLDSLPHGETEEDTDVAASQADLEDRLQSEFEDFLQGGVPFGVLWIGVDQAHELRRTHGAAACHAMLAKVWQALAAALRPSDVIGRWGDDEFLVIAHERTAEMLAAHAQRLAGLARTADFRWWGDRVSLTVSIGAAQVEGSRDETLALLLERSQNAMEGSMREGGNRTTSAPGVKTCLPS